MNKIEAFLRKSITFEYEHRKLILSIVAFICLIMFIGISKIEFEGNMDKSFPQDLPVFQLMDTISDKFGGQDVIILLFGLDTNLNSKDLPKDIRDISIVNYLIQLENSLNKESSIESVFSIGTIFKEFPSYDQNTINTFLNNNPQIENSFVSANYDYTFMVITADLGGSPQKITSLVDLINDKIESYGIPPGTKIYVTGTPPLQNTMVTILQSDALFTLILAFILIFIFLIIMEKSFIQALFISFPLIIGLIMTMGTMGFLGLKITFATAGLGAMLLGLGVEYGVFMLKRYEEQRELGFRQLESLQISVPAVGSGMVGSGLTTIVGFMALTLSFIPMMQQLGLTLAIGIFYTLFCALFVAPLIYVVLGKLVYKINVQIFSKIEKVHNKNLKKGYD